MRRWLVTDVDVIVVNYLTGYDSVQTAARIAAPGVEIWLVDNSGEILESPPDFCHVLGDGHNAMYAPASNLAYRQGTAELVLLLNPDVALAPEQLPPLVAALDADDSLWAVAPALVSPDGSPHNYLRRLPTTRSIFAAFVPPLRLPFRSSYQRYLCLDVDPSKDALIDQPAAACLLVRRSAVGEQLFDERYRLFFNDTDLSRRMSELGWRCRHLVSVQVPHVGGASIDRERELSGTWVSDEYDRAAAAYVRVNLKLWALFLPVVWLRLIIRRTRFRWARRSTTRGKPAG
jgi:GT2 family glycosyltransferase